jgi:thioredoxin 2
MEITQELLREKIANGDKLVVDFWAPWCGPCKLMKPIFESVANEVNIDGSNIRMYTLNVEENRELSSSLGIRAIPTIKGFNDGDEVFSKSGALNESMIKDVVNSVLNG